MTFWNWLGQTKVKLMQLYFKHKYNQQYMMVQILNNKMLLSLNDRGISFDLLSNKIREKDVVDALLPLIKEDMVILDIGANIGYYTLMLADKVGTGGRIYAIEPDINNYAMLKANIGLNLYDNVKCYNLAFGNENKNTILYQHPTECNRHTTKPQVIKGTKKQSITMTTVDTFLNGKYKPDIIRMDVEGYEYEIIKSMKELLSSDKPLILIIEFHKSIMGFDRSTELYEELIEKYRFEVYDIVLEIGEGWITPRYLKRLKVQFDKRINNQKTSKKTMFEEELRNIYHSLTYGLILIRNK